MKRYGLKRMAGLLAAALLMALLGGCAALGEQMRAAQSVRPVAEGLYALEYEGDYGFDAFLAQGGAETDEAMAEYIISFLSHGFYKPESAAAAVGFGCSTLTARTAEGGVLMGRNYDWTDCGAMLVHTKPADGYESVSTCCLDFLGFDEGWTPDGSLMNRMMALAAIYVPLDGMNEKGLCVADLMAGDKEETHPDTGKPDLTVAAALRLLLDKAANVDEALALLEQYDIHSSIGSAHHFALADASGRSVVVEYIDGEMQVTATPIVTNHYLTEGEKYGVGSDNSHERFDTLTTLRGQLGGVLTQGQMRDCLRRVAAGGYPDPSGEKTQWSWVYSPNTGTASFYWQEDFSRACTVTLRQAEWLTGFLE